MIVNLQVRITVEEEEFRFKQGEGLPEGAPGAEKLARFPAIGDPDAEAGAVPEITFNPVTEMADAENNIFNPVFPEQIQLEF